MKLFYKQQKVSFHLTGGKLVLQHGPSFDAARILSLVAEEDASTLSLVGDAMAIPLIDELRSGNYDMSNLAVIASAGAILSATVQAELEELLPDVMIINSFGTSESGDLGRAAGDEDSHEGRPSFYMGDDVTVLDENGDQIEPGSGQIGMVARSGRLPLGYYKDAEKAAQLNAQIGAELLQKGNLVAARDKLERALKQDNKNALAHLTYAQLQHVVDEPKKAKEHFGKAIKIEPDVADHPPPICQSLRDREPPGFALP